MDARFLITNTLNLLLKRELHFQFDRIPLIAKDISNRKLANLIQIGLNRILPISHCLGFPYMAHIAPSGLCDLKCSICPVHSPQARGKQLLSFETFKAFIDQAADYLVYIILWSWGEPLLNKDIYKMIKYAKEKGIVSVTSSNLNSMAKQEPESLIKSGLDALIIALDGASPETYSKYREGGNFKKVVENTRMLVEIKKKVGAVKPIINLRMVVSKENEHEIKDFKKLAKEIGVDMVSLKAFSTRQAGYTDLKFEKQYTPQASEYRWYKYQPDYAADKGAKKYNCKFPWTKPMLFADGTVTFCEFDYKYKYPLGNINEQSFKSIWFSEKSNRYRKRFLKHRDSFDFCKDCVFDYKVIPGCVLEWEFLKDTLHE